MGKIAEAIRDEVLRWPDVTAHPHRFGGVEFQVHHREIGHLHGDRLADLPFPKRVRDELIAAQRALPHHVLPDSGWVSFHIRDVQDVRAVLGLFRLNYDCLAAIGTANSTEERR
jgi:hypothetical protein